MDQEAALYEAFCQVPVLSKVVARPVRSSGDGKASQDLWITVSAVRHTHTHTHMDTDTHMRAQGQTGPMYCEQLLHTHAQPFICKHSPDHAGHLSPLYGSSDHAVADNAHVQRPDMHGCDCLLSVHTQAHYNQKNLAANTQRKFAVQALLPANSATALVSLPAESADAVVSTATRTGLSSARYLRCDGSVFA